MTTLHDDELPAAHEGDAGNPDAPTPLAAASPARPEPEWALIGTTVADVLDEAVLVWGVDGRVHMANPAASVLWAADHDTILGLDWSAPELRIHAAPAADAPGVGGSVEATLTDAETRESDGWIRRASGDYRAVHVRTAALRAGGVRLEGAIQVYRDVTELAVARQELAAALRLSVYDGVTGLPGRAFAEVLIGARQDDLDRHRLPYGLLLVRAARPEPARTPLDPGHPAWMAETLRQTVRSGDTVVRWDDGVFGVVASQVDEDRLARFAERLVRSVRVAAARGGEPGLTIAVGAATGLPHEEVAATIARVEHGLHTAHGDHPAVLVVAPRGTPGARVLGAGRPSRPSA